MNVSELVRRTVATGIPPLELTYRAVRDCRTDLPVAYRTEIAVNSVELGRLMQSDFSRISDSHELGIRVSEWGIGAALREREQFRSAGRHPRWISVSCPAAYAELPDLYNRLKGLLGNYNKGAGGVGICLEFPDSLLLSQADVRTSILDLKLLGVHSLLVCNSADTCPFFKLVDVPFDTVLLTPRMTRLVNDRNKPGVLSSLVQYLHSMHVGVIADGVEGSEEMRAFARMECEGCVPAGEPVLPPEDAVLQKEDES